MYVVQFHACLGIETFYQRFAESKWTQVLELKRNTNKAGKNNETYKICVATTMTKTATMITKTHNEKNKLTSEKAIPNKGNNR